jgi:hypothetical protein
MKSHVIQYEAGSWQQVNSNEISSESVNLILVYADRLLLEKQDILKSLAQQFPSAKLIVCSTAGEIYQRTVTESAATAIIISFDNTAIVVETGEIGKYKDSYELGRESALKINQEGLKYLMVLSDGSLINGDELILGIKSVIGNDVCISGGLAGDGPRFQKTLVGCYPNVKEGNLVLVGLYGEHIKVATGVKGGWDEFGPQRTITKSFSNVLYEIDGVNALELYKKYLGSYKDELPGSALLFPISIKTADTDFYLVRTILSIDEEKQCMVFAGNIPEGSAVRFMKSNPDRLVFAAADVGGQVLQNMQDIPIEMALIVSCVGRKIVLSERIEEEVEAVAEMLPASANVAGFFSYGEIAPHRKEKQTSLHNQTITITAFAEIS